MSVDGSLYWCYCIVSVPSGRTRQESEHSGGGHDEVFDEDANKTPQKVTSPKKEETTPAKIIPAEPPKENVWAKRMQKQTSPASAAAATPPSDQPSKPQQAPSPPQQVHQQRSTLNKIF